MSRSFCPRTFGRLCWQTLAIILVVFALGVSLFRGLLPKLDQVRQQLVSYIEQEYQVLVNVTELTAEWQAFGPAMTVKNLVLPPQGNLPFTLIINDVNVKLDFWQSLMSASPQIENVIFEGVQVALDLDRLNAAAAEPSGPRPNTDWVYKLLLEQLDRFAITDVKVQLLSDGHQYPPIHINNLRWRNRGDSHRGQGQLFLDSGASEVERLSLSVEVNGDGGHPETLLGQIYLAANSLDLGEWASRQVNPYDKSHALPLEGVVNLQAWASFAQRQITSATVAFNPSWLQWQLKGEQQKFEIQAGQFNWLPTDQGWHLSSSDLAFATNQRPWPQLHVSLSQRGERLQGTINRLDTSVLLPLLPLLPGMELAGLYTWQGMSPSGTIVDARFEYELNQDAPALRFSAKGQQLAWQYAQGIPGSGPIDVALGLNGDDLYVSLPKQDYRIDFDSGFAEPLTLSGEPIALKYDMDQAALIAPRVQFANADLSLDAALKMQFAEQAHLSLLADVVVKDAANAQRYFPQHGMSNALIDYLTGAIKAGRSDDAKVLWHGALANFPYDDNSGVFQAGFSLQQARYQFVPEWPEVDALSLSALFENAAMDIWVEKGKLLDVVADGTHVGIARMGDNTVLTVKSDLHTHGDAAKAVLLQSPLRDSVGATLEVVQVQGEVDAKLDLTIPLYDGGQEEIRGSVTFNQTPVYITQPGVQLNDVTGNIYFVNEVVTGEAITAQLFDQPVSLTFDTGELNHNYGLNLDMQGRWQLDGLSPMLDNPLSDYYQGNLDWQGALTLIFDPLGYRMQAQVTSDLQGVSLTLPGDFSKSAQSKRALSIELIGDNKQSSLGAKLGEQLEFWGGFNEQSAGQLAHFDLLLGRTFKPGDELRRNKGHLQLDLPETDFVQWLPIIQGLIADVPASTDDIETAMAKALTPAAASPDGVDGIEDESVNRGFFPALISLDGNIDKLLLFGQPLTELALQGHTTEHGWRFEAQAKEFLGRIDFYPDWATQGIKVVASHFDFAVATQTDPSAAHFAQAKVLSHLPPLAIDIDEFSFFEKPLGHLVLQASPENGDYHIQTISLTTEGSTFKGKGAWLNSQQQNRTEFDLDLKASTFDEVSERLGIDAGLKESPVALQAQLSWAGAPYAFSLETLNGQVNYQLGKGHLSQVSDKGARIFSLFSLDSLLRKLSLDFSDVFGKGLYFNSFTGTLTIDNGVVKTTDSEMDAVAGNMRVRGYTDLTTESLNYDIRFVPQLASSVPTVVLLSTGGWTLGLGAFALTKVLEPVIEVISEIRFRLTGTMSEPKLEELERKSKEIEIPESVLPEHLRKKVVPASTPPASQKPLVPKEASPSASPTLNQGETAVETNAAGVEIPQPAVEVRPEFDESPKPIKQQGKLPSAHSTRDNKEPVYAGQLITMSKQSRCQRESSIYRRAA